MVAPLVAVLGAAPAAAGTYELEAPENLRITDLDLDRATVEWDPTPGATRYSVVTSPSTTWRSTEQTNLTFPIQRAGAEHRVTIRAYDDANRTSPASELTFTAPAPPPPAVPPVPEQVTASPSPGEVTVGWEPSIIDGDRVESYLVKWTPDDSGEVVAGTSITREVVPGGEFEVTVAARHAGQVSEASQPEAVTVPPADGWEELTAPSNLRLVADDQGIVESIEWDAAGGGQGPVTYDLIYRFGDQPWHDGAPIEHAGTDTSLVLADSTLGQLSVCPPDPRPGDHWEIWITARSQGVTSPPSEEIVVCF